MSRRITRTLVALAVAVPAGALVAAPHAGAAGPSAFATGVFGAAGPAYTYDTALVPAGATAVVRTVETGEGSTVATLQVRGFAPGTAFDVHAHTGACGASPAASAGHYKNDPAGPADPANELWLGFTTGGAGNGSAQAAVGWLFRAGEARSITVHAAGSRVACLDVTF